MGRTAHDYDILTRLAVGNGALVYRAVGKITRRHRPYRPSHSARGRCRRSRRGSSRRRRGKRRLARRSASFRLRPPSVPRRKNGRGAGSRGGKKIARREKAPDAPGGHRTNAEAGCDAEPRDTEAEAEAQADASIDAKHRSRARVTRLTPNYKILSGSRNSVSVFRVPS